jgi:hypothetical protein
MAKIAFGNTETLAPATPSIPTIVDAVPTDAKAIVEASAPLVPTAPTQEAPAVPTTALAVATPTAVAANPGYYDDENIPASDLKLPRLNIVQKVGELSNNFAGGTILLDGNLTLVDAPKGPAESAALRFLVIGLQDKRFVEKVEGGLRGNTFLTEAEVVKAGGTLDYNEAKSSNGAKPLYQTLVTAMIVIEKPTTVNDNAFPITFDGKKYALALYSMKGTSYTNAAKHLYTARKFGNCAEGFRFGWWTMTSRIKAAANSYFIPTVRQQEKSTPAFRAFLTALLGF